MTIRAVTVFETRGQQFPTMRKALDYREGLIERYLRECPGFQDIPASRRIDFIESFLRDRHILRELLDYSDQEPREE